MALIEEALVAKLLAQSEVTNIVVARVYGIKMPDNPSFPNVTYQRIATDREYSHTANGNFTTADFQVDCWARGTTPAQVKALARAVTKALSGYRGVFSGVDIQSILQENEVDSYDEDTQVYRVMQTYRVQFIEVI